MLFIVTYDIVDDRRRIRLAKAIKDFGNRVQYSVFECLMGAKEFAKMTGRIAEIIDHEEDSVRIYKLCAECEGKLEIIGSGARTEDPEVYII
ncbi:MAG: CRISPR-associated endonuclease Cas2 [Desulfobacteraceae bacterium]|nr:CRISPR-associated endonuclease Cas2 [Desulfobacteraceae bacterium]